jgi:hypothetical protein
VAKKHLKIGETVRHDWITAVFAAEDTMYWKTGNQNGTIALDDPQPSTSGAQPDKSQQLLYYCDTSTTDTIS